MRNKLSELGKAFLQVPKMFRTVWRTDKLYLIFIICEMLCFALLPYPALYLAKYALDAMGGGKDYAEFAGTCMGLLFLGCSIGIAKSAFNSLRPNRTTRLKNKLMNQFHQKCMELDYQLLAEKEIQELQALASEYVNRRMANTIWNFIWLFSGMISFTLSFIILFRISVYLIIAIATQTGAEIFIASRFLSANRQCNEELILKNRRIKYFDQVATDYENAKDVRIFPIGKNFKAETLKAIEEINSLYGRRKLLANLSGMAKVILSNGFEYLVYAVLGISVLQERISIGTFSLAISNIAILKRYFNQISNTLVNYSETARYIEYYEAFMSLQSKFKDPAQRPLCLDPSEGLQIEFRNVAFRYPGQTEYALKNFNVRITGGEKVLIVGENGSGKSTFVKLLMRLYDPDQGEILLNGINIKQFQYDEYLALFASVFQDFKLFAFSVRENITSFDEACDYDKMRDAARKAEIAEKIDCLPWKYETYHTRLFENDGVDFSGGEQQKIAIARAYYKSEALITVLDEPTSAMDPRAEYQLYEKLSDLIGGNIAFFISHRLSSARFCDKILVIREGKNIEFGTHDELMEQNGVYKDMFSKQADYYV